MVHAVSCVVTHLAERAARWVVGHAELRAVKGGAMQAAVCAMVCVAWRAAPRAAKRTPTAAAA
eukprot:234349-Pleurochrysis_carterae.AAC.1